MCGICGKLAFSPSARVDERIVERMAGEIVHRGPDDHGFYTSGQVALGHRRLSIIDLGTGKQPISNEDQTVWIVYNGEIYNFKELKKGLVQRGHSFRTETDTEVIVHLYEEEGAECVRQLRGMFAFALWDEKRRRLLLARDRVGIKPLYYCRTRDSLLFASEIKALLADPAVAREIDPQTIDRFLTYFYTPGPETLLRGVRKLEPGHYLLVEDGKETVRQYWDLQFTPRPGPAPDLDTTAAELVTLLADTVRDHMISDVPVGVLLSGGVDSTAMLSFAVQGTEEKVRTFTVGFSGAGFPDERPYASLAAKQFGNEHHEMSLTAADFQDFLPKYVWHMEEPVCEPPAVALYYVTKLAREYVKVLISGEGGDEAFAGYQNYRNTIWLERFKSVDGVIGRGASHMIQALHGWRALSRFQKYAWMLRLPLERYYYSRTSGPFSWFNQAKRSLYQPGFLGQLDLEGTNAYVRGLFRRVAGDTPLNQMLYVDTKTWLPDDLLIKADKITMANSLELRVPLLDHKVLEFAAALPASSKVRGFTTKYILKKAFQGRIPKPILSRKKTGFPVPYAAWLRHELKDFVSDLLLDRRALERGYFEKNELRALLDNAQRDDFAAELFSLVTLELWHRQFVDSTSASRAA